MTYFLWNCRVCVHSNEIFGLKMGTLQKIPHDSVLAWSVEFASRYAYYECSQSGGPHA